MGVKKEPLRQETTIISIAPPAAIKLSGVHTQYITHMRSDDGYKGLRTSHETKQSQEQHG
eukprot:scaffold5297_cov104-Cylindrotheca_fusiformis.AAC.2